MSRCPQRPSGFGGRFRRPDPPRVDRNEVPPPFSRPELRQLVGAGHEFEREAVVAVALAGRRRAVIEHMALMPAATSAVIFRARIDELEIGLAAYGVRQRLPETWPAGAALVFFCAVEQGQ